jgi:crossover junction endodeoxyribonuclease RusA
MITVMLPAAISTNRYWRTFRGMTVVSKEAKAYKQEAGLRARLAGLREPIVGPVQLVIRLLPKMTKKGEASQVRCDLDNIMKVAIDALNGIAYKDDKQVVRILAEIGEPVVGGGLSISVGAA